MEKIKHILLPTDFSPCSDVAAAFAAAFAKKSGAKLTSLHISIVFEDDPHRVVYTHDHEILAEPEVGIRRRMEDQVRALKEDSLKIETVQIRGLTVASTLSQYAEDNKVDLIVMGTHGRRGFKHWLLGSVAEELVRNAPCPVLSVKESWKLPDQVQNILVPVDFSLASRTALQNARYIADLLGANLQVLHVVQSPPYPDIYTYASIDDFYDEARSKSQEVIATLLAEEGPTVGATIHVVQGHPGREILSFAETNNTHVIMMAHLGISGISDRILGSVTEHVVRGAKCPVLTADLGQ